MLNAATFDEVLDAIEHLPEEQQVSLVDIVRRRIAERGRQQIIADARSARDDFVEGRISATSVDELMREIES